MYKAAALDDRSFFNKKNLPLIALGLVALIAVVVLIGNGIISEYRRGMGKNSASLLLEYGNQVTASIDRDLSNDWNIAASVAATLNVTNITSVEGLLPTLNQLRSAWQVKNINVYTDSGYGIDADGRKINEATASELVYQAKSSGSYLTVVKSEIDLVLPVTTGVTLNGEPITAVAVVVNLEDFIKNLNITSFNNTAGVYLVRGNGLVISQNTDKQILNIGAQLESGTQTVLSGNYATVAEAVASDDVSSFLYDDGTSEQYVVVMPVSAKGTDHWSIVLTAPTSEVDHSMNAFAGFVTTFYIILVVIIVVAIIAAFYSFYRQRTKNLDEVLTRERMLNLLVSNTNNVFFLFSKTKKEPLFVSSNATDILGPDNLLEVDTEAASTLRFLPGRFVHPKSLDELNTDLSNWNGETEYVSDYLAVAVHGEERFFVMRLYPSEDVEADYIVILADLTKERERQDALKGALAMADDANKAKTLFLSNMSHDIRTPMNAIVNMTDFALQSTDDPQQLTEYLNTIKASSAHLLRLINNVLDMSRIESGKTAVEIEPFVLTRQLEQIREIMEPLCANKRQQLDCSFAVTHDELQGDTLKLKQILINLLNNASKFTPEGGTITFKATEERSLDASHISYRFTVRDTGVGISEADQEKIFVPFARLDNQPGRKTEGSGLGLSICRSFAEAMGGSIAMESTLGQGSVFTVILPFKWAAETVGQPLAEDAEPAAPQQRFDGIHALVCEDNAINRTIAEVMLKKLGFEVTMAEDGQEGCRIFEESSAGTFDVIFMDIQMPVMNGYEATAAIRASRHPQAETIPIIAMTANVFKEDIARALAAGMNAHIGKPLSMDAIIRTTADAIK
jgi:two-component system sensor histidine kinase/response regulator